ncbi:MAG: HNH endonuclease, partial [Rhodococcus sp. (in: high G+C Gram-positive bacteria)]
GSGLCEACNYAKEGDGWSARAVDNPGGTHLIDVRTPTGHQYRSAAPQLPAPARRSAHEAVRANTRIVRFVRCS